jgi:hypothetical protein
MDITFWSILRYRDPILTTDYFNDIYKSFEHPWVSPFIIQSHLSITVLLQFSRVSQGICGVSNLTVRAFILSARAFGSLHLQHTGLVIVPYLLVIISYA